MKTITLIGMMGSGKTTLGLLLSKELKFNFADIDSIIENSEKQSISEIFQKKGEPYFRNLEQATIKETFQNENLILSLGGGAFENKETQNILLNNSYVIYLKTSASTIFERLKTDTSRPLLNKDNSVEKIQKIITSRKHNYELAHKTILTDNKKPQEIIQEILGVL